MLGGSAGLPGIGRRAGRPRASNDCSDAVIPGECSLTVGELETCVKDSVDALLGIFTDVPSCGSLTRAFLQTYEGPEEPADPASCETVNEDVPASRKAAISTTRSS